MSVAFNFLKNENTWCRVLVDLISRIRFNFEIVIRLSRGGGTDDILHVGSQWRNSNRNRNVPYLNEWNSKRKLDLNWFENDWNEDCRFLAVRNSLHFSAPRWAEFSFCVFLNQPPNCRPTSFNSSDRVRYFLSSSACIPQVICNKNLIVSSFREASSRNANLLFDCKAPKINSITSINNRSIFIPKL